MRVPPTTVYLIPFKTYSGCGARATVSLQPLGPQLLPFLLRGLRQGAQGVAVKIFDICHLQLSDHSAYKFSADSGATRKMRDERRTP
jgi:hypothetical protein